MQRHGVIRVAAGIVVVIALLAAGLFLDLRNHGLAWNVFWSLTGEEEPFAQIRGVVEWFGNATRVMPQTDRYVPIDHVGMSPYGINTFLQLEADPAVRERSIQMIADAGFKWIRQQFPWEDIEIHGRGDFDDRRNESSIGIVSAWDKYDQIVNLAGQYEISIQARVDTPPAWTRANPDEGTLAPPDDWEDYYTFLRTVAERYKGKILDYQIWNEPNIRPEWGNNPVNPEEYTAVLCRAYQVLKSVDPNIVVHSAALSPTVALTDVDLSDLIFLQRMYDAGAKGCFDVMSAQGYGFYSGPTDQRLRATTLNFARPLYIRDIMVANGDASTPMWISEAAWNPVDEPDVPDIPGKENFGSVTEAQAARYMPLAYQRAEQEWNWIGVIMYWYWKRPDEHERDQPMYYFRMVNPDMTPQPIYDSMKDYIAGELPILYGGVHQADDRFITASGTEVSAAGAQFGTALQTEKVSFTAQGTDILARWSGAFLLRATIDGEPVAFEPEPDADGWTTSIIEQSSVAETHTITLDADQSFLFDSVAVYDRTLDNLLPPVVTIGTVLVVSAGLLIGGWLRGRRE